MPLTKETKPKIISSKFLLLWVFLKPNIKVLQHLACHFFWYCYDFMRNKIFYVICCLQPVFKDLNLQVPSAEVIDLVCGLVMRIYYVGRQGALRKKIRNTRCSPFCAMMVIEIAWLLLLKNISPTHSPLLVPVWS